MKKIITFLFIGLIHFSVVAQTSFSAKEKNEVAKQVETMRKAMISGNEKELTALTSGNLIYGHSSGNLESQKQFIENIVSRKSNFISIDLQDQTITIDENVAIVRHNLAAHTKDGGVDKDIKIGVMLVWQKQKKEWILIARQAYKLPIDTK